MAIKVKVTKKQTSVEERINEGAPAQPTQTIDAKATNDAINAFLAGIMNNVKNVCSAESIVKSIPQVKTAKDMENSPYTNEVTTLENTVKTFASLTIDANNAETIKSAITYFTEIINGLEALNGAIANNQSNDANANNQQTTDNNAQQQTTTNAQSQQTANAQTQQNNQQAQTNAQPQQTANAQPQQNAQPQA